MTWDDYFKKEQKVGLALGGGAVLGAAHIGVLRAIEEFGIEIDCIAGTSIGAFVAGLYAFGLDWEDIQKISENLDWLDISGLSFSNMGLLSNRKMGELIREKIGDVNLEDSPIPVAMIAADIETMEKVILTTGDAGRASMASTSIPGIFTPVEIDGRLLVDGGIVENVPISPLVDMGVDIIIAVDLNSDHKSKRPENILEILLRSFVMSTHATTQFQTRNADILIKPDLSEFNVIDMDQSHDLIEKGYQEALKVLMEYYK
ncbi:MAG: patatin-like phospholipase family protein [Candidatus Marinimicrobia bacterium]|nr:patatin-like phospholipase family protein [Candidatus Neomarinimicrobiota bacterium]